MANFYQNNKFDLGNFNESLSNDPNQNNQQQMQMQGQHQQYMQGGMQPMQGGYPNQQQMYNDPNFQMAQQQQFMNQGHMGGHPNMMGAPPGQQYMVQQQQFPQGVYMVNNQMAQMGLGPQVSDPNMMLAQQQQMMAPGANQGFPINAGGAPPQRIDTQANQQQQAAPQTEEKSAAGGFNMDSTAFNFGATEFVPIGQIAKTKEQFPGLGEMEEPTKKSKKNKKKQGQVQQVQQQKAEEDDQSAWKGKPSKFFVMIQKEGIVDAGNPDGFELNNEQWGFMYQHYPEYCGAPYQMMTWLRGQALAHEELYNKGPSNITDSRKKENGKDDDKDELVLEQDSKGLSDMDSKKAQKKKDAIAQQNLRDEAKKQKVEEIRKKKLAEGRVIDPSAIEIKPQKYKDMPVDKGATQEVDKVREPCSMVFIGHVDAGKSTICGNLMFLNGVVDARTIQKYKEEAKEKNRDSWWLAYVMDVSDEEKAKGKTVEVGRAQFDTPKKKYTIFDAPGHKNYVPNMIMGAALADVAGLVISARKGEFEAGFEQDGQTREHAQLAKSLGVQRLIVIINKMDDCKWSKTRYSEIEKGLLPFLESTGYGQKDLIFVPIAGLQGHNIAEKVPTGTCNWYKGPTLMEILNDVTLDERHPEGALRIPILDKMKDPALVLHGKVENGTVRLGDKLAVMPHGNPAQVLQLMDGKGQPVEYAAPGENVQIKINVGDDEQIQRGYVLCHRESPMPVTEIFEAEVQVLELVEYKPILTKGYTCMMHIHTYHDEVIIKDIVKSWDKNDRGEVSERNKPQFVRSQAKIICRIQTKGCVSLEKFDVIQQMGRFTLRDEGRTICVGKVLKYKPYVKSGNVAAMTGVTAGAAQAKTVSQGQQDMVYDMETGEMRPKKPDLEKIAEGNEDDDN